MLKQKNELLKVNNDLLADKLNSQIRVNMQISRLDSQVSRVNLQITRVNLNNVQLSVQNAQLNLQSARLNARARANFKLKQFVKENIPTFTDSQSKSKNKRKIYLICQIFYCNDDLFF